MNLTTVRTLIGLNNRFYAEHAASFSATRNAPWEGWARLGGLLRDQGWSTHQPKLVLDLACGNLRFERFLSDEFPKIPFTFHTVDSCPALAEEGPIPASTCIFHQCDILETLLCRSNGLPSAPASGARVSASATPTPPCDLAACFGFMHHVPSFDLRRRLLTAILETASPKGLAIVSFWQFMNDGRLAHKASQADAVMRQSGAIDHDQLDAGDHFLGWQTDPSPLRYCHHFDEHEIDELVASVGTLVREVARYSADGASGTLNRYVVLQRLP